MAHEEGHGIGEKPQPWRARLGTKEDRDASSVKNVAEAMSTPAATACVALRELAGVALPEALAAELALRPIRRYPPSMRPCFFPTSWK
jgi:hypothetical protein